MDKKFTSKRILEIYFAGAGMDGEPLYELCGLTAEMKILTNGQLYEELEKEAGLSDEMIKQHRQRIDGLPTAAITDGRRPSVRLQV